MRETWLANNRRAIGLGMILPASLIGTGAILLVAGGLPLSRSATAISGIILLVVGVPLLGLLIWQWRQPRIARRGDELLFYLRSGTPERVPLSIVEGFLLGQGPSFLKADRPDATMAATVVVRLASRATDYAQREVKPALGSWCNHYITIRGTWCEPLSVDLVQGLNERLAAAQRTLRSAEQVAT